MKLYDKENNELAEAQPLGGAVSIKAIDKRFDNIHRVYYSKNDLVVETKLTYGKNNQYTDYDRWTFTQANGKYIVSDFLKDCYRDSK